MLIKLGPKKCHLLINLCRISSLKTSNPNFFMKEIASFSPMRLTIRRPYRN